MKKAGIIALCTLLSSCSTTTTENAITVDVIKIEIPIDESYLNSYQIWDSFYYENDSRLIAYNEKRHSFDLFSLDQKSTLNQVELDREGPNGIEKVDGLHYHNEDSIFLFTRGKLYISSLKGKIKKVFSLYEIFDFEGGGEASINYYFKLRYQPGTKSVPFYIVYHTTDQSSKGNLPLIGLLNLETMKIKYLPIYHTNFFKNNSGNVGFITYLGFNDFFEGNFIFNLQYQSNLFSLKSNGEIENGEDTNYILPLINLEDIETHAITNTHYLSPIPDPWRKLIYRFNWEGPIAGKENSFLEKKTSLTVFDSDLNKIQDFSLPNYTYQIHNWFVTKNGLFLNVGHPSNPNLRENILEFHIVEFTDAKF